MRCELFLYSVLIAMHGMYFWLRLDAEIYADAYTVKVKRVNMLGLYITVVCEYKISEFLKFEMKYELVQY